MLETALKQKLPKLTAATADLKILLLERADVLGGYHRFGVALEKLLAEVFAHLKPDEIWLVNTVGLHREDVLYFYKIWPAYFEDRVRRGKDKIFRKM